MVEDVVIEMMAEDFPVWRCLHDGPLDRASIEAFKPHPRVPWERLRPRNLQLLRALTTAYSSCAVLARNGQQVVGQLRFYPKAVCGMEPVGALCLQQVFPAGPRDDLTAFVPPPLAEIEDKTLSVHCLMIASLGQDSTPYHRKGIGTRMVRHLIDWAGRGGWRAIEAVAYCDLPSLYSVTGQAGRTFWQKLGFREVDRGVEFNDDIDPFVQGLMDEAKRQGIDPATAKAKWTMRLAM